MNDKSIKEEYNKVHTVELPEIRVRETLTHHELMIKVERYKPFLQDAVDYKKLEKLLKNYLENEGRKHIVRAKRDDIFRLGDRTGLSPDKTLSDIYKDDELVDEHRRQKIANDVKKLYRKNFSVLKMFTPPSIPIGNQVPMVRTEKTLHIKMPHKVTGEEQKQSKQKHFKVTERFGHATGSKNQMKPKETKENILDKDVENRFNMASKMKEPSKRLKNYDVYKTINRNNKTKPKEKGLGRDR